MINELFIFEYSRLLQYIDLILACWVAKHLKNFDTSFQINLNNFIEIDVFHIYKDSI